MKAIVIIQIVSVLISIVAPIFLFKVLKQGFERTDISKKLKKKISWMFILCLVAWIVLIYVFTFKGLFAYQQDDQFPTFLYGLFIPFGIVMMLLGFRWFRTILDHTSIKYLAIGQIWRIFGSVFFLVAFAGIGPMEFVSSGFGDLLTGVIAMLTVRAISKNFQWATIANWSLLIIGVSDLLIVLYILLTKYPIWSNAVPSTAMAGSFPMMLIVGIAAPIALSLHIFMLRKLLASRKSIK